MTATDPSASAWTRNFYPRLGDGVAFDRVVFFCDAVFAIALTLAAVEIGIPEVDARGRGVGPRPCGRRFRTRSPVSSGSWWRSVVVAFYWRANHRFTMTLRGMDRAYVGAVILYLGLISLLPLPAAMLGEYAENPLAVTIFALYASAASGMEVVLFLVADRRGLFVAPLSAAFRRQQVLGFAVAVGGVPDVDPPGVRQSGARHGVVAGRVGRVRASC